VVVLWVGVCVCVCVYVLQVVGVKIGGKLEVRLLGSGQEEGRWL
jgi:hypothetical protein